MISEEGPHDTGKVVARVKSLNYWKYFKSWEMKVKRRPLKAGLIDGSPEEAIKRKNVKVRPAKGSDGAVDGWA